MEELVAIGLGLVLVGTVLIFLGAATSGGDIEAGGVVFIGLIPVPFGTSREMILLALFLGIATLFLASRVLP